jgi:predicted N-acetyltransferase YhbS
MFSIREETAADVSAREDLLDTCLGSSRQLKTCERLREGRLPAEGLALVIEQTDEAGARRLVGTVRLWQVAAGPGCPALMLGPLAVDPALQGAGLGAKLMRDALVRAAALGHRAVLLVGDAPYYARFGFSTEAVAELWLPGPYEAERFQGLELVPGGFRGARGLVSATGRLAPKPDLAALLRAMAANGAPAAIPRAA